MHSNKPDFSAIDALREGMLSSLHDLDFDKLKNQVEDYNQVIRATFSQLSDARLDAGDVQSMQQFLVRHQQLVQGFEYKRRHVAEELKKMKRGRDMQLAYKTNRK